MRAFRGVHKTAQIPIEEVADEDEWPPRGLNDSLDIDLDTIVKLATDLMWTKTA